MTTIFIPSLIGDSDSLLLATALETRGNKIVRWVGDEFPKKQVSSFYISNDKFSSGYIKGVDFELFSNNVDVVWLRRPRWPVISNILHPEDKKIAKMENQHYIRSFFQAAWQDAIWVNSLEGRRKGNSKIFQLQEAARLNILIPETLISNNPHEIRNFINLNENNVIVKPLLGGDWSEPEGRKVTYTASVSTHQLPKDELIQACPCIYQKKILKIKEVRLVFFGAEAVAAEIDSQTNPDAVIDWRFADPTTLNIREITIPNNIYEQCRSLMKRIGILHGSFDFAINDVGQWVFFEFNEAGQFLWLEFYASNIPVLEIATQFFSAPSIDFKWNKKYSRLEALQVSNSTRYQELIEQDSIKPGNIESTAFL